MFSIFEQCKASVDVVASSDVSVSMTLDPKTASSVDMDRLMVRTLLLIDVPSYHAALHSSPYPSLYECMTVHTD